MTSQKSYSRYFIILQEDEKGYALASDKLLSGYAKFENKNDKCKISYYVQNLKKQMEPYYLMLICNKKDVKKIIKLGIMNIDDYGRMETCYEYSMNDIAKTGITMDKVVGAAVVKIMNSNIVPVMSGFTNNDSSKEWLKYSMVEGMREEEVIPKKQPEIKEAERVEVDKIIDKPKEERDKEKVKEQVKEKIEEKTEERTAENVENQSIFDQYEKNIEDVKIESPIDFQEERKKEKKEEKCTDPMVKFFNSLTKGMEEVEGICSEIKRCKWYKVHVKNMQELWDTSDYQKYSAIYYPMIGCYPYIRMYGHYLVGCKLDTMGNMKYMVYGIPGIKAMKEQPFGGKTGFVTWVPLKHDEENEESMGYWLMFYDPKNAVIAIPVKN